jgi:hypothetical protein
VENYVCLSQGVQVTGVAWWAATRIVAGVGDLEQRTGNGQAKVGYSVVGWLICWVTLCADCTMHEETRSTGFFVERENQGRRFLLVWPQNRWLRVFRVGPQNCNYGLVIWVSKSPRWFPCLGLKTKWAMVCQLHQKTDGGMKMARARVEN